MQTDYIQNIDEAERRMIVQPVEVREEGEDKFFEGYGIIYDTVTDIGDFTEEVALGAADDVMNDDVRGLFNHGTDVVLGRTKSGTMKLSSDKTGVKYQIRYNPNDPDHVRVREKVNRGDVSQSSFAFRVKDDKWEKRNGKEHRRILKFQRLIDMSLVTYAAYNDTTVAMRSLENLKKEDKNLTAMRLEALRQELNKPNN